MATNRAVGPGAKAQPDRGEQDSGRSSREAFCAGTGEGDATVLRGRCPECACALVLPSKDASTSSRGSSKAARGGLIGCPCCSKLFSFPSPRGEGPTVLVALSNQQQAAKLVVILDEAGFHSVVAADAVSARRVLESHVVRAVFVEPVLPGAPAFDWIPELRGSHATRDLPIILVGSMYNLESYRRHPVDLLGADGYVGAFSYTSVVEGLESILAEKAKTRRVVETST